MAARLKINTLQSKVEFIILSLGGKPDPDVAENNYYINKQESISKDIKAELKKGRQMLADRQDIIDLQGYMTKERVMLDEEIRELFDYAEQLIGGLREFFKRYQAKNGRRLPASEIEARARNIDLLRKNLNLLKDEYQAQIDRSKAQEGRGSQTGGKDFVEVFGYEGNAINGEADDEQELSGAEKGLLKQFEENDKELEEIAGAIANALDAVKNTAENIEMSIEEQGKMLKAANAKANSNKAELNKQNNDLKVAIEKHKGGKQCAFDLSLFCCWLVLFGLSMKILEGKGYI